MILEYFCLYYAVYLKHQGVCQQMQCSSLWNAVLKCTLLGLPWQSVVQDSISNAEGMGSIPDAGRSPREGNGNPLQYAC